MQMKDEPSWQTFSDPESERLEQETRRLPNGNWKRWGPYLSERQVSFKFLR
jgi:hypothetical protein